jgi:non-ribosomal peptide synthetase component F
VGDARAVIDVDDLPRRGLLGAKPPRVGAGSLAYLYYTSGTTGRPKGVADSHRNVLHNVQRYTRTLGIGRGDRLSLDQSPSFSGAVSSTYAALLNGGTLCAWSPRRRPAGADWLAEANVTIYHSVPALFRALVTGRTSFPRCASFASRHRALAGDADLPRTFPASSVLVNGLSTTETGSSAFLCRAIPVEDGLLRSATLSPMSRVHRRRRRPARRPWRGRESSCKAVFSRSAIGRITAHCG